MTVGKQIDSVRISLILEIADFFNKYGIGYLLGGGTACELIKEKEIYKPSNKVHDIDFHVWKAQKEQLNKQIGELTSNGYEIVSKTDYKVQIKKSNILIEILFIFEENGNICFRTTDPANNGKRCCTKDCFEKQAFIISNETIDVVSQKYCECLY
ncbi:MAG: hypothetical protein Q8P92_04405 [Candidatus Daviesbacteria bacterium]|nr:hypothetical protein [Candidatus Daviesbacteria bacterium]